MINIRNLKDSEDRRLYAGSIYKDLAEYISGEPLRIIISPSMSLHNIGKALFNLAEILSSGHDVTKDVIYQVDPDDPADYWKEE